MLLRLLRLAVEVREDEVRALAWSFAYFFSILAAYFILRPLRVSVATVVCGRESVSRRSAGWLPDRIQS